MARHKGTPAGLYGSRIEAVAAARIAQRDSGGSSKYDARIVLDDQGTVFYVVSHSNDQAFGLIAERVKGWTSRVIEELSHETGELEELIESMRKGGATAERVKARLEKRKRR